MSKRRRLATKFYILADRVPVPADLHTWGLFMNDDANVIVKQEDIGALWVSTVFLGLDHNFSCKGPPLVFETKIFHADDGNTYADQCSTWLEAERMHAHGVSVAQALVKEADATLPDFVKDANTID